MLKIKKDKLLIFFSVLLFAFLYIIYLFLYADVQADLFFNLEKIKFILSWVGILLYVFSIYSWYKKTSHFFDLYTILLTFLYLFNFGQCFLWAFGIHTESELGKTVIFNDILLSSKDIVISQLITLISCFSFHIGSLLISNKNEKTNNTDSININNVKLKKYCKIISIIVIPLTFVKILLDLKVSMTYGYSALYYGNYSSSNLILTLISRLFFPCIFGLLITNKDNDRIRKFIYILFFIYVLISLKMGERGTWFFSLLILIYLYHCYVKKLNVKNVIKLSIGFFILSYFCVAIVSIRNSGINSSTIFGTLDFDNNPIVSAISELGGTMSIQTVIAKHGYFIYPYGNTYLFSLLGVVSDKIIYLFGFDYVDLSSWFSQVYLKLKNWGAGFSMIGETLINFGPYFGPIFMGIIGFLISNLIYIQDNQKHNYLKVMFSLICFYTLVSMIRGTFAYEFKIFFFDLFLFYVGYKIFSLRSDKN